MRRITTGIPPVPYYPNTGGTKALPEHIPEDFSDFATYTDFGPAALPPPMADTGNEVMGELLQSYSPTNTKSLAGGIWAAGALAAGSRFPVQRGSASTPNAGLLGVRFPFLSIVRPRVEYPSLYNEHFGRPTFVSEPLKNFEGYTVVAEIHLDGVSATMPEKEEIEQLLKGGVIL